MQNTHTEIKVFTVHRYTSPLYDVDAAKSRNRFRASSEIVESHHALITNPQKPEHLDQRVRHTIELMEAHLDQELNLSEMSSRVNLSLWHLSHLFKSETGYPPAQYLKRLRLNKARELLETTFLNIKEIKNMVGIRDESHFARSFKKTFGVAPARHRALYLSGRTSHVEAHAQR